MNIGNDYCKVNCNEDWSDGLPGWERVTRSLVNLMQKPIWWNELEQALSKNRFLVKAPAGP